MCSDIFSDPKQILFIPCQYRVQAEHRAESRAASPSKSGKQQQRTPHNGSLSRAGSLTSINLDTWDMMEPTELDNDKDRRIRELEETLRY